MGMMIKESLNNLIELQKDYQQFHDDVWQDPESYGIMAESLQMAISIMRKYQKIEQLIADYENEEWEQIAVYRIREIIDGKDD